MISTPVNFNAADSGFTQFYKEEEKMFQFSRRTTGFGLIVAVYMVSFLFSTVTGVYAHDFWVTSFEPKDGLVRGNIGYGHDFPNSEPIAAERVNLFEPLQLVTPNDIITLDQVGENYAYQKKVLLQKGSYMIIGFSPPSFWSKGPGGWAQKDRIQRPDATYAKEAILCAKTILNVRGAADDGLITKPVGQRLEIVPMINPDKVKVGNKFPVKVLCDGKPAKTANVEATFAGFSDKNYKAFQGRTDLKGVINIIPLKSGYWIVKAKHILEHSDKDRADELVLVSTLTFKINR